MSILIVSCPNCESDTHVPIAPGELKENATTEGLESKCGKCKCEFSFDVYVEVLNKDRPL